MSNASFTRDEAILALDVFYSAEDNRVASDSKEMDELSRLLRRLPIHQAEKQNPDFRSSSGITNQLNLFRRSLNTGKKHPNVGKLFFDVAFEYENKLNELHDTAQAIRRNEEYFLITYGAASENDVFPEGILLSHLHRKIEVQVASRISHSDCCAICNMKPELYYQPCGSLLQLHLLVPPALLDGGKKYGADSFITVCPTCHAALHAYRPWLTRENCGELLR